MKLKDLNEVQKTVKRLETYETFIERTKGKDSWSVKMIYGPDDTSRFWIDSDPIRDLILDQIKFLKVKLAELGVSL
jgi:hypothetical protein